MARRGLFPPVSQSPPGQSKHIHSSFDPVDIRVSGGRATSEAFCLITSAIMLHGVEYELASSIRLATRLEKCAGSDTGPDASAAARHGQWRMLSLEAIYVRDRLVSAFPDLGDAGPAPLTLADLQGVEAYPQSYWLLALVMLNGG
ncbi:hypothetical protein Asppvi_005370 [Aspergillus pseudoviridinutans]|uniref:Uncharacterized protein n=1 Tax=Aspergillus pseudoviridinutans TaxID=1517512 RepID=A0A9P3BEY9_9EURO|nr:uncharacterized protein Asppvi_005370 [Aspergillus pseudoviridinutans]GIJ86481.1 hypothetical protein Asppvi_005370 [Aspergillus pseudoviridinutans]